MSAPQGLSGSGDADLVAGVLAGDRSSFAALYDRYADRLYDFCYSVLRDRDEAADAVQDTFVLVAERLGQLREPERLRPWLYAIARSAALRRVRARSRVASDDQVIEMADQDVGPAEAVEQAALRDLVWSAAAGLSDRDRVLLDLHLRQGLEGVQLGEAMGVSAGHSYVLLTRLRNQVERSLGALLVARLGRKGCAELDGVLAGWDGRFSPLIRKRVARHVDKCSTCTDRRRRVASPWALLSTVALVPAPLYLRKQVLEQVELVAHRGPPPPRGPRARPQALVSAAAAVLAVLAVAALWGDDGLAPSEPAAGGQPGRSAVAPPKPSASPVTTEPAPFSGLVPLPESATGTPAPADGAIEVSTTRLDLDPLALSGTVVLRNTGGRVIAWTARSSAGWLSAKPASGELVGDGSAPLTLRVDPSALSDGNARAHVVVTWDHGSVPVLVTFTAEPTQTSPGSQPSSRENRSPAADPTTPPRSSR